RAHFEPLSFPTSPLLHPYILLFTFSFPFFISLSFSFCAMNTHACRIHSCAHTIFLVTVLPLFTLFAYSFCLLFSCSFAVLCHRLTSKIHGIGKQNCFCLLMTELLQRACL
ncbi:hypothetical protein F5H01DRAFT_333322, partial [Linnemannia elongata]